MISGFLDLLLMALLANEWPYWPMNGLTDGLLMAYLWIEWIYCLIYGLLILLSAN